MGLHPDRTSPGNSAPAIADDRRVFSTHQPDNQFRLGSGFYRRCRSVPVRGVSLHSYRYAWAERAKSAGYPERHAQNALGHDSRAIHAAYAKGAIAM